MHQLSFLSMNQQHITVNETPIAQWTSLSIHGQRNNETSLHCRTGFLPQLEWHLQLGLLIGVSFSHGNEGILVSAECVESIPVVNILHSLSKLPASISTLLQVL
jgi:hypothetical protein